MLRLHPRSTPRGHLLPYTTLVRSTGTEPGPDCVVLDIGDTDRHAAARCDDDLRQIALIGCLARHTDQDLLAAAFDVAGAAVGIIALECSDDIVERQIECRQRSRVRSHMILPGVAADRVDLGEAGDLPNLRPA